LTSIFPIHRLCRRKTSPVRARSPRRGHDAASHLDLRKGHNCFASLTCGRLDWCP
jgi:hypothetical protein